MMWLLIAIAAAYILDRWLAGILADAAGEVRIHTMGNPDEDDAA